MTTAVPETPPAALSKKAAFRVLWIVALAVLLWFAGSEVATYAWYSSHEAKLPRNLLPPSGEALMSRLSDFVSKDGTSPTEQDIGA
ncbi:MAG TPA: hypothetical protein VNB29_09050, partial [Chthoniobacterales bacterium]|nr:hypothetical protein [Chthoniobacterales bacterium]